MMDLAAPPACAANIASAMSPRMHQGRLHGWARAMDASGSGRQGCIGAMVRPRSNSKGARAPAPCASTWEAVQSGAASAFITRQGQRQILGRTGASPVRLVRRFPALGAGGRAERGWRGVNAQRGRPSRQGVQSGAASAFITRQGQRKTLGRTGVSPVRFVRRSPALGAGERAERGCRGVNAQRTRPARQKMVSGAMAQTKDKAWRPHGRQGSCRAGGVPPPARSLFN